QLTRTVYHAHRSPHENVKNNHYSYQQPKSSTPKQCTTNDSCSPFLVRKIQSTPSHEHPHTMKMSRSEIPTTTTHELKKLLDEKSQTIVDLRLFIDELEQRFNRKEKELLKRINVLYNELQYKSKKLQHIIYKHSTLKYARKLESNTQDGSEIQSLLQKQQTYIQPITNTTSKCVQTDEIESKIIFCENCQTSLCVNEKTIVKYSPTLQIVLEKKDVQVNDFQQESPVEHIEEDPKYYVLQSDYCEQHVSPVTLDESVKSPVSTTDRSLSSTHSSTSTSSNPQKQNESSSSAYNTAESLQSFYSDEIENLERVLNASSVMYTRPSNLQHTIALQEELFRQRLRLRGIHLTETDSPDQQQQNIDEKSDHIYDNIESSKESDSSDIEQHFILHPPQRKRSNTDYYSLNKRRLRHYNWQSKYMVKKSNIIRRNNSTNVKGYVPSNENCKQNDRKINEDDYVKSNSKNISQKMKKNFVKSKYGMMKNINEPLLTVTIT
ncbi:unnamed protein product, partial [Didymodactylos carnosus]